MLYLHIYCSVRHILGYDPSELLDTCIGDLWHPDDSEYQHNCKKKECPKHCPGKIVSQCCIQRDQELLANVIFKGIKGDLALLQNKFIMLQNA